MRDLSSSGHQEDLYSLIVRCGSGVAYEKRASVLHALAHGLASAAAGHLTTNALGTAAHHASNVQNVLAHRGVQHGLDGQHLSPVMKQSIKSIFGPESLITYEAGHGLAQKLLEKYPEPTQRLTAMWAATSQGVHEGVPVAGAVQRALANHVTGTVPKLQASSRSAGVYGKILDHLTSTPMHGMETGAQKLVKNIKDAVPAVALMGVDTLATGGVPVGALGHFAWNGVRQAAGHTDIGQHIVANEVVKGLQGQMPNKVQTRAYALGVSPAFLDARRIGHLAAETAKASRAPQVTAPNAVGPLRSQVARGIERVMGEPAVRLLPHIKVSPR